MYRDRVMYDRPLDISDEALEPEGPTVTMYVDRNRLWSTAADELLQCLDGGSDFRTPIEVVFYGESAVDMGNISSCVNDTNGLNSLRPMPVGHVMSVSCMRGELCFPVWFHM